MAVRIGSNSTGLSLRRQIGRAGEDLSAATQRLASGQRIVRPGDDPAGNSIATQLNIKTRLYTQGLRNLNDGISAISMAEAAMGELDQILTRIDELALQSRNGIVSDTQRSMMQTEVTALQSEWNRIVTSTTYNDTQLLTGDNIRFTLQGAPGTSGS